jgi:hypothetical protein
MSKQRKVNPDHYKLDGALAPDDQARERVKQRQSIARGAERAGRSAAPNAPQKPVRRKAGSRKG